MNEENVKDLSDSALARLAGRVQTEIATRARRREEAIVRIKALAGAAGVTVFIKGSRGRPPAAEDADGTNAPQEN